MPYDSSVYFHFRAAVDGMAVSANSLQERLGDAYRHVSIFRPEQLPEEIREAYRQTRQRLTQVEDERLGSIMATALSLPLEEAQELAFQFVHFADVIAAEYHDRSEPD